MTTGKSPRRKAQPKNGPALPKALQAYSAKRAFEVTPEPAPAAAPDRPGPLLFVVQQHAARRLHFDFRLEAGGVLKSWAVPKGPSLNPADKRLAVPTEDHPFEYGSFEGVIPEKQYGAGEVIVWDCGSYSPDEDRQYFFEDRAEAERRILAGLEKGKLSFFLRGVKLKGSFALVRTSDKKSWLLIKHKDGFVDTGYVTARERLHPLGHTGRGTDAPAAARAHPGDASSRPPVRAEPLPAKLPRCSRARRRRRDEAGVEVRAQARRLPRARLHRPRRRDAALAAGHRLQRDLPRPCGGARPGARQTMVLDGEIVGFEPDGKPSFDALQDRAQSRRRGDRGGGARDAERLRLLRSAPLRRHEPAECLIHDRPATSRSAAAVGAVQLAHADDDAEALYDAALASGFEGSWQARDSPYLRRQTLGPLGEGQGDDRRRSSSWAATRKARAPGERSARCCSACRNRKGGRRYVESRR